jgi:hypothetical protein
MRRSSLHSVEMISFGLLLPSLLSVWMQQRCSQADATGCVYAPLESTAGRLGLPIQLLEYGVRILEQADAHSIFVEACSRRSFVSNRMGGN